MAAAFYTATESLTMDKAPKIYVTESDFDSLERLLDSPAVRNLPGIEALWQELHRAQIVPEHKVPAEVITMNSRVRFRDETGGALHELTLVYPQAVGTPGSVSITAPVGSALLGLSVGQSIEWQVPGGRKIRLKVLEVLHQPEAAR